MKILLRILGVLLLIGGLIVVGVFATSNLVSINEKHWQTDVERLKTAEAEYQRYQTPESEKVMKERASIAEIGRKAVERRKSDRLFDLAGGGIASILGIGLLGISFVFGRK